MDSSGLGLPITNPNLLTLCVHESCRPHDRHVQDVSTLRTYSTRGPSLFQQDFWPIFFSQWNHDLHYMCNFQSNKNTSNAHCKSDSMPYRAISSGESKGNHAKQHHGFLMYLLTSSGGTDSACTHLGSKALLSRNSTRTTSHPAQDENILATEQHCRLKLSKVRAKAYTPRKKKYLMTQEVNYHLMENAV